MGIKQVIFVHDEAKKEKIEKFSHREKIQAPKGVGKIELKEKPKNRLKSSEKPMFYQVFPIKDWGYYLDIVKKANKALDGMKVTLSRKARVGGKENPEFGSIWFTCGSKDFREHFRKPLAISDATTGLREMRKDEIKKLSFGVEFYLLWINDQCETDLVSCVKSEHYSDSATEFFYEVIGDESLYSLEYSTISDFGKGRFEVEDFHFFISKDIENI